jgi:acetyl esterase
MSLMEKIKEIVQTRVEGIEESDRPYLQYSDITLNARLYRTTSQVAQPILIDIHGGVWNHGDRTMGVVYDRSIAAAGVTVLAIDFRQGPDYQHPSAVEDIEASVSYAQTHAHTIGGDPHHIGLIGSSSGGHLALLSGITSPQHIDYIVALWPVSDPAYRYAYAKRMDRTRLMEAQERYFGSIDNMQAASIQTSLESGNWNQLPPLLVVQPGEDENVPREMTKELVHQYESAGGYLEYAFFPGESHGFTHLPSPTTDKCNALIVDFIRRHSKGHG